MPLIEINVSLDVTSRRCHTDVRAFLDFHPEENLNSEIELRLWPTEGNQWRAMFSVDEPCERFAYRIGIAAHPEAGWQMRIRNCNLDVDLLLDSDKMMLPKSWLIGECSVRPRGRKRALRIHGL
jgi:hypothetical protein